ncbi:roquin-1-like [Pocillopora damicornis]|uniref:roquin-1-like n=1 Tax=Pocillopora damicornis TaxID=46731 RepID=UPI000F54D7DE|nr:roquin-1-like [Pocillopora damicornis]
MPIQKPQGTEFLQCPICYKEFDNHDRQPISLGCGHTFCVSCLSKLSKTQCPTDQAPVETDISKLPYNFALLQLVGEEMPDNRLPPIDSLREYATYYLNSKGCIEKLALFLKPVSGSGNGTVNGKVNGSTRNGSVNSNGNNVLTRPMQRKLVTLVNCQLAEGEGRSRAMRAARSLGERTVTELILLHQQVSANIWAAVRNRGCQFLGPAMQEEALKLILLALEGGEALSRKVLVLFVVQKLESVFPQASKTSIGHVVQLLYRASCFKVEEKNNEPSLMQLKEQYRTYDALRKVHDAQIVQIATEAGLRILPDKWSSLLYGDMDHKSHMQSIIDKLQTPASFSQSIQELIIALQRSGDPGNLCQMRDQFELLSHIDASPEASCPAWDELEQAMVSVHSVVHGFVNFSKSHGRGMKGSGDPPQSHNNKFKTSMCRDHTWGGCPRGPHCTFAHSKEELEKFGKRRAQRPRPSPIGRGPVPSVAPDQFSPLENGCDGSPTATQAPTNCVNGSARSSPL